MRSASTCLTVFGVVFVASLVTLADVTWADGRYLVVEYPPSMAEGELQFGVTYTLWIPDNVKTIRSIIVHQHGCGSGACKGGQTAAYDLHWQALARKWDSALLGPSYHQEDGQNCRLWCDPRNGSEKTFLRALDHFAVKANRPELSRVPWCLWGHSGGGFWASVMQALHPTRIVAIWFRSGTAYPSWESGEIPKPELSAAVFEIPIMLNPGVKERDDQRFSRAWNGSLAMFQAYRAKGAPAGFAPDPRTGHECGDCRYLAIPFFDACLSLRLPPAVSPTESPTGPLRQVDLASGWLAVTLSESASPADKFDGNPNEATWLPNESVAKYWSEYVKTGATTDVTPPPSPKIVSISWNSNGPVELRWDCPADPESGIQAFAIQRNGEELAQHPAKPVGRFGRPLFQSMSYHDTPERPVPEMRYRDETAKPGQAYEYKIFAINGQGLRSEPAVGKK